ncbi:unnamed protein product [Pedinophyceae sp. YPF-701]|nr:unnamed protein product [Pedinophyceae sp. YPF-701]
MAGDELSRNEPDAPPAVLGTAVRLVRGTERDSDTARSAVSGAEEGAGAQAKPPPRTAGARAHAVEAPEGSDDGRELRRRAWNAWVEHHRGAQRRLHSAAVLGAKQEFLLEVDAFAAWRELARKNKELRRLEAILQERLRRSRRRGAFDGWVTRAQHGRLKRQAYAELRAWHERRVLRGVLTAWHAEARDNRVDRAGTDRALEHYSKRLLERAAAAWLSYVGYRRAKRRAQRLAAGFRDGLLMDKAWYTWRCELPAMRSRRIAGEKLAGEFADLKRAHRALQVWRGAAGRLRWARAAAEAAAGRLRELRAALIGRKFARAWRDAARARARALGDRVRSAVLQGAVLGTLGAYAAHKRRKRALEDRADAGRRDALLRRAWAAWQEGHAEAVWERRAEGVAWHMCREVRVRGAWRAWRVAVEDAQRDAAMAARADRHRRERLAWCAIAALQARVAVVHKKREALAMRDRWLKARAVVAWHEWWEYRVVRDEQDRAARRHCYLLRLRRGFAALRENMEVREDARERFGAAIALIRNGALCAGVLRAWRREAVPALRDERAREEGAAGVYHANLLARAMDAWGAGARVLRLEREKDEYAELHREHRLLTTAVAWWRGWARERSRKARVRAATLSRVVPVLEHAQLLRTWQAWRQVHWEGAVARMEGMLAGKCREVSLASRALAGLGWYVRHAREKREAFEAAETHDRRVALRSAFGAWARAVDSQRAERWREGLAVRHAEYLMQRRAWAAWTWYIERRRQKATERAQAVRDHVAVARGHALRMLLATGLERIAGAPEGSGALPVRAPRGEAVGPERARATVTVTRVPAARPLPEPVEWAPPTPLPPLPEPRAGLDVVHHMAPRHAPRADVHVEAAADAAAAGHEMPHLGPSAAADDRRESDGAPAAEAGETQRPAAAADASDDERAARGSDGGDDAAVVPPSESQLDPTAEPFAPEPGAGRTEEERGGSEGAAAAGSAPASAPNTPPKAPRASVGSSPPGWTPRASGGASQPPSDSVSVSAPPGWTPRASVEALPADEVPDMHPAATGGSSEPRTPRLSRVLPADLERSPPTAPSFLARDQPRGSRRALELLGGVLRRLDAVMGGRDDQSDPAVDSVEVVAHPGPPPGSGLPAPRPASDAEAARAQAVRGMPAGAVSDRYESPPRAHHLSASKVASVEEALMEEMDVIEEELRGLAAHRDAAAQSKQAMQRAEEALLEAGAAGAGDARMAQLREDLAAEQRAADELAAAWDARRELAAELVARVHEIQETLAVVSAATGG